MSWMPSIVIEYSALALLGLEIKSLGAVLVTWRGTAGVQIGEEVDGHGLGAKRAASGVGGVGVGLCDFETLGTVLMMFVRAADEAVGF
eukprot:293418-Chlamydomonas_euryale.AAC.1